MNIEFTGTDLKVLRILCKLTSQELGDICGVTKQTICNWENGKTPMSNVVRAGIISLIKDKFPTEYYDWVAIRQQMELDERMATITKGLVYAVEKYKEKKEEKK